jgi:ORMDL family
VLFMAHKHHKVDISENISWTVQKGASVMHFILTFLICLILTQAFGYNMAWQLTVIIYNILTFIFFHWIVGDPFDTNYRNYTFWEQITEQLEHSYSLIFMSVYPVLLFMAVNRIVVWNTWLFYIAVISLAFVVVPKLGFMHMKRIFGIKRFD